MSSINIEKIDLLIQYALAVAAQEDDSRDRSLGPIHFIKYVYLADLAYSQRKGETFTGAEWQFHKFGPWSLDVYQRVEPALLAIGAEKKEIPSKFGDEDFVRWTLCDRELAEKLEKNLHVIPCLKVKSSVHKFTSETPSLLEYVYLTKPMLTAAPGDYLDLSEVVQYEKVSLTPEQEEKQIDNKAEKLRKKNLNSLKKRIQARLAEQEKQQVQTEPYTPPRYDEVFSQGQEWLDSLAGEPIECLEGEVTFSPDIWKSRARFDPDFS